MSSSSPSPSLALRIRECSRLTGTFVLRSGKVSDTYFDKYQFESDPVLLRDIAEADGQEPEFALCVIDRQTGGKEALAKEGLSLVPLLTFAEIESA